MGRTTEIIFLNYIPSDDPIISPEDDDPGFFKIPFWQGVRQVRKT